MNWIQRWTALLLNAVAFAVGTSVGVAGAEPADQVLKPILAEYTVVNNSTHDITLRSYEVLEGHLLRGEPVGTVIGSGREATFNALVDPNPAPGAELNMWVVTFNIPDVSRYYSVTFEAFYDPVYDHLRLRSSCGTVPRWSQTYKCAPSALKETAVVGILS